MAKEKPAAQKAEKPEIPIAFLVGTENGGAKILTKSGGGYMQVKRFHWKKAAFIPLMTLVVLLSGLLISRQFARINAIQRCNSFRLIAEEQPFNIQMQMNTYGNALDSFSKSQEAAFFEAILPVWVVNMDGKWHLSGGPAQAAGEPELETEYFDHCIVFVNVFTRHAFHLQAMPITFAE